MRRPRPCQSSPHLALEQAARIDASAGRSGQTGPVSCPPWWLGTCGRGLATYGWAMPLAPGAGRKCPIPRPNAAQSFRACAGRPAPAGRSNSHHNAANHQRSGRKAESCDQFDPEWREDDTSKAGTNIGPTGATVRPTLAFRRFQRFLRFEIRGMLFRLDIFDQPCERSADSKAELTSCPVVRNHLTDPNEQLCDTYQRTAA